MTIFTTNLTQLLIDINNSERVSVDIETTGLDPLTGKILLIQLAPDSAITPFGPTVYVLPVKDIKYSDLLEVITLLSTKICIAHNLKFETSWILTHFGVIIKGYCSMLAEKLLNAGLEDKRSDLASVSLRLLGKEINKGLQKSFVGVDPETFEPTEDQISYAAEDAAILFDIREIQVDELIRKELIDTAILEFNCLPIFSKLELRGMRLDVAEHAKVIAKYQEILEENTKIALDVLEPYWEQVQREQQQIAQVEYDRVTRQIGKILEPYGGRLSRDIEEDIRLEIETLRKSRKKAKPNRKLELSKRLMVLAALKEAGIDLPNLQAGTVYDALRYDYPDNTVLKAYAKWSRANKILTTYGQNLVEDIHPITGRVHGEYNAIVSTGRTSSSNPNMQNIPPEVRACFRPEQGNVFIIADFSGMELRIAAGLSQDPVMLDAFSKQIDLHKLTASMAWPDKYNSWEDVPDGEDRAIAKTANFATIYSSTAEGLFFRGVIDDLELAKAVVKGIQKAYPIMTRWVQQEGERSVKRGYAVTPLGRKRFFPLLSQPPVDRAEKHAWYKLKNKMVREASNHPVQGTGSDISKLSMVLIDKELPPNTYLSVFVHDELCYETPIEYSKLVYELVERKMEEAGAAFINNVRMTSELHIRKSWNKKDK